jgi:2-iminobutanoate/2-iminopropanoate deaminase
MAGQKTVPFLCGVAIVGSDALPPRFFPSAHLDGTALPFSEAVQVGNLLFVSGQIGNQPGRLELVAGGMAAEARQALENVKSIVERHGSSLDAVVKCTVFLADMGEWGTFNDVYGEYFVHHLPARSALGANGLALGARVEVECIACLSPGGGSDSVGKTHA